MMQNATAAASSERLGSVVMAKIRHRCSPCTPLRLLPSVIGEIQALRDHFPNATRLGGVSSGSRYGFMWL